MEITCLPLPDNGNKIDAGFVCSMTGTGNFGSLTLVDDGQGGTFYVNNAWTGGETIICSLLVFLTIIVLTKIIFDFFLPPRIRIKKNT